MEKSNSNLTPLLKGEIEGDYQDLLKNKNKVLKLIENINSDIETFDFKNKRQESISAIKEKFDDLEKNMKKFSQGVSYINSYYKNNKNQQLEKKKKYNEKKKNEKEYNENDDDEIEYLKDENLLYSLSHFSKIISNNFEELNKKFENKIKIAERKNEGNKLSQSYDVRKSQFYSLHLSKDLKRSNTREKIKMEQRELNQLLEKSKKILAMSNDIKKITEENNNLLSHTSTNFDTIENNLINGNEELKKLEAEKVLRNKRYFWIGGGLFIIIIIVIVFIYVKYNTPSKSKNNV